MQGFLWRTIGSRVLQLSQWQALQRMDVPTAIYKAIYMYPLLLEGIATVMCCDR